jgi:hypothetical protein
LKWTHDAEGFWTPENNNNPDQMFYPELTAKKFDSNFHAYYNASYIPHFLSDPVDYETPDFQPTPVGLGWWMVGVSNLTSRSFGIESPLETMLTCLNCSSGEDSFCGTGGTW